MRQPPSLASVADASSETPGSTHESGSAGQAGDGRPARMEGGSAAGNHVGGLRYRGGAFNVTCRVLVVT